VSRRAASLLLAKPLVVKFSLHLLLFILKVLKEKNEYSDLV